MFSERPAEELAQVASDEGAGRRRWRFVETGRRRVTNVWAGRCQFISSPCMTNWVAFLGDIRILSR